MKRLTDIAKVRKKWPNARAYQWGPRDWTIYADEQGPLTGIALANSTSKKGAWYMATLNKYNIPSLVRRRVDSSGEKR